MSTPPYALWTNAASDAAFTDPVACAARASALERQIANRNRLERIAGLVQLPVWGSLAVFFWWVGEPLIAATLALIGAGVVIVLRNLVRRASLAEPLPEESCLAHLERQVERQHNALLAVPVWYIGPLLPGVIAFYGAAIAGVAESRGWRAAIEGAAAPFAITFGLFTIVILLNWLAARALARDLERLKRLA